MSETSMLHVRMDEKLKVEGMATLDAIGLSAADAVRILFKRIVAEQAFPLDLKVPNAETRAAMEEARQLALSGGKRFDSADQMFASLEKPKRK